MFCSRSAGLKRRSFAVLFAVACCAVVRAQDGLKTIDNPGGGQMVYGSVPNQTTAQGAMGAVLRYTHGQFGDRPQIGTVFQSRDGQTFGASFSLTAVKQGNKPIAGLVMVSMSVSAQPAAAVLYDDRARFPKTQTQMLHTLSTVWEPAVEAKASASTSGGGIAAHPTGVPPLHMTSGGDGSGHIGLPDGWHITAMRGGQCAAEGPNGEMVGMGLQYHGIHDPNMPAAASRYNTTNGRGALFAPYNGDLFKSFVSITNQNGRLSNLPEATFTLISAKSSPSEYGQNNTLFTYEVDAHDGKGLRIGSAMVAQTRMQNSPTWTLLVQSSSIPKALAEAEAPTVHAIVMSYNQDAGVMNGEIQSQIARTRAVGERAKQQAADADARRVATSAAFNQHMNDIDIASKNQQNYMLERTEIQDNTMNTRGAIDNNVAAALIKANPERYQEVPSSSFLKGVDY